MQDECKTKGELITEVRELRQRLLIFEQEQQELKQSLTKRKRAENIMLARLRLLKFAESHSLEEFTQATLDELEALTTSKIGFYHLVEADQRTLSLQTWSTNTLQHMCRADGKGQHYDIAEAGVWVDCMHQRRPIIHNNYDALPHRKGMPPGHAPVVRELVVPIFRDSKIVSIIGVGNKPSDYDEWDVEMVSLLGDLSWDITERKRAEEELHRHREELQIIMDSVPAMIFYKDKENRLIRTNQALARAMGLSQEELNGNSISDLYPEQAEDYWKDDLEVMSTGIPKRNIVEPLETSTGLKWVQTDKIPYMDAHGNVIGIIGFSQDITERKNMEEALRRAYDELEERVAVRTAALRLTNEQLLWEIEERQQAEKDLKGSEKKLRYLAEQLLTAQETERSRLSRELHDDLGQALLVLRMQLNAILRRCSLEPEPRQSLEEAAAYLLGVIDKVRRLSHDLSPSTLERLGLSEALQNLFEDFQKYCDREMIIRADLDELKDILPEETNIVIYRITQELLANVHKHSEVTRVAVAIKVLPEKVTIALEDNGKGFDLEELKDRPKERRGLGVASMEERLRMLGSQFSMTSQSGQGTRLYFEIKRISEQKLSAI
jgi:PAS domain S-box-containing protein